MSSFYLARRTFIGKTEGTSRPKANRQPYSTIFPTKLTMAIARSDNLSKMESCNYDSDREISASECKGFDVEWTDPNTGEFHLDCESSIRRERQVNTNYFVEESQEAFNLFRLARVYVTRIPVAITRYWRVRTMNKFCRDTLLKLLDVLVKRLSTMLLPSQMDRDYTQLIVV